MAPTTQYLVGLLAAFAPGTLASCAYGTHLHPRAEEITAPTFSYWGSTGPAAWHAIAPANELCATGTNQSPISVSADTSTTVAASELTFTLGNWAEGATFENLGSTVEVIAPAGNLTVAGVDYSLAQFHFHLPSEHLEDGKSYAMEMHMVWQSAESQLAVTGIYIDVNDGTTGKSTKSKKGSRKGKGEKRFIFGTHIDANVKLTLGTAASASSASALVESVLTLVDQIPNLGDHVTTSALDMGLVADLFAAGSFSSYAGSLTTPPCSEGVSWFVSTQKVSISTATFVKAANVLGYNARFPQNSPGSPNVLSL